MIKPYVYKLTHKKTNQFYIGYRCANKLPPDQDIYLYKSSSKIVKELGFDNFTVEIIAMFLDKSAAYDFEQILISENIKDPLILNRSYFIDTKRFVNHGHTEETKQKMSSSRIGVKKSPISIERMKRTKTGKSKPSGRTPETDSVAITNIKNRIKNLEFQTLKELSEYIRELSLTGMSNVQIGKHLNLSNVTVGKYKQMFM